MDDTQDLQNSDSEVIENTVSQDGFATLDDVKVQDGEIVSKGPQDDNSQLLLSLDQMIKANFSSIDKLKVEVRKLNEMIQDGFNNDAVYKEHDDAAKEAAKVRQATKAQIMKQPAVLELVNKLKTLKAELKDKEFSLSDYLLEYQRVSGANQIEMDDGEILEIVNSAKIVRKSSK